MVSDFKEEVKRSIERNKSSKILVHSDVLFGFKLKFINQNQFLEEHYNELKALCGDSQIIMPSFNYDFCKGFEFNPVKDLSQVGVLSEYFRTHKSKWRSETPVFSFSGTDDCFIKTDSTIIDPFDEVSLFGVMNQQNGLLMHYGSGFHTTTLIHYVERISGSLKYRYDKIFPGKVIRSDGSEKLVQLKYHVRPSSIKLEYDWVRLEKELLENSIIQKMKNGRTLIILANINKLVLFWLKKIESDSFYFLNPDTRKVIEAKYKELKRPFLLEDFE